MPATIEAIEFSLPERIETAAELVACFPQWNEETLVRKTGVRSRHLAAEHECASDLGAAAAEKLLVKNDIAVSDIDFLIFCTQTPDYLAPTTACLLQQRLGLGTHVGALDINLGCSGYPYSLGIAKALLETGQAHRLLLITGDTYSKFVNPGDRGVRALFGDGATATLLSQRPDAPPSIGPFLYGTDGSGGPDLVVPSSAMRNPPAITPAEEYTDARGNTRSAHDICMNGRAIVEFTKREAPQAILGLCNKAGITLDDVDVVVPHQASALVLEGIRERLELSEERFLIDMATTGNTISSTIPILLKKAVCTGRVRPGALLLLVGFGVGLSWSATLLRLPENFASVDPG